MLSKKHFAAIAKILREEEVRLRANIPADPLAFDGYPQAIVNGGLEEVYRVTCALADYFQADNPKFDRARFMNACTPERKT